MDDNISNLASSDGVSVHSGFPNPAADQRVQKGQGGPLALDLNQLLLRHPDSSYLFRISGHRWADQGINDGDIAIIDRSTEPRSGDLVIVWQDDSFNIRPRRQLTEDETVWGIMVAVIHQYR
jgi:DNA polymerase V